VHKLKRLLRSELGLLWEGRSTLLPGQARLTEFAGVLDAGQAEHQALLRHSL
jgi:hypothetical protein